MMKGGNSVGIGGRKSVVKLYLGRYLVPEGPTSRICNFYMNEHWKTGEGSEKKHKI